ncbi:BQ2448_6318 [Microbotryum intermedium]|uniref:BQ2448_6318 protein n=1 Tax=Microbotryum intermedium TaxID=269621 RepID=A0A238FRP0_9BASI|nr:BQ2448_6318 [Microbotryum intermedium]
MPSSSSIIVGGESPSRAVGARGGTTAAVGAPPPKFSYHRRAHSLFPLQELALNGKPTRGEIGAASISRSSATVAKNDSAPVQLPTFQFPPPATAASPSSSPSIVVGSSSRIASHKLKRTLSIDTALASASYSRRPRKVVITADENDQGALLAADRLGLPLDLLRLAPDGMRAQGSFNEEEVPTTVLALASTSTAPAMTATIRAPAAPRALRRRPAPSSNDFVRSDVQNQSNVLATLPTPIIIENSNTGEERAPSRFDDSSAIGGRGLRRSSRASVTSYYDPSDASDDLSSERPRASTSQLRPQRVLPSHQTISVAPSTNDDDDDDFAPPLSSRLSYPDDARKISEAEAELRLQSSRAQGMTGDKGRMLFAKTWLQSCYEPCKGFNVGRSALYASYVTACQRFSMSALNTATFGKMIRAVHPNVLTRRLGGRTDSRYHYIDFRPANSQEYKSLVIGELKRGPHGAAPGEGSRLPSPFRAAEPQPVVVEQPDSTIVRASISFAQRATKVVEVEAVGSKVVDTAEAIQPRALTRRRNASAPSTRAPVPSLRPARPTSRLVAPSVEQEESPATPAFHSKLLRSFEAVFEGNEFEDQNRARSFWQSLGLHISRLEGALGVEKYDLFLDELKGWWTKLAPDERQIAVSPHASRGIYRAFVAIYEVRLHNRNSKNLRIHLNQLMTAQLILDGSRKALLALAPLAQLESLGILAAKIETASIEALHDFSGTFFFDTLVGLSKQVGPLFTLSQSCRVWANNLQSSLGAHRALNEFEQAWRSIGTAVIQQRCALIKPVNLTHLHKYTALVKALFEPLPISASIEDRLRWVVDSAALSFGDVLACQDDAASIAAECNLIGSQFARELNLSHPAVAVHFQSLHFLIEDLLILHGQVLQTEKIVSAPVIRPVTTGLVQTAAVDAHESPDPEGMGPSTPNKATGPLEVEDRAEETRVLQALPPPPSSDRHPSPARSNAFASPERNDSAANAATSLLIPSIIRQSPEQSQTDKPHPVSSSPMWMPPRRAPLVAQAVQRANLAQDLLALESPPPFVLSPRMLQNFADRQREGGPVRSRSPVIGAYEWSNERGGMYQHPSGVVVEGLDEVDGVGSSTAAAVARGGELLDAGLTTEVPNTAAYYAGYWR